MDTEGLNYFQLDCTRMHKYDAPNDWFASGKEKPTNELVFALDGECIITIDGSSFIIKPNMLMVFPMGRSFSNRLTEKKKFLYYQCHFDARVDGVPILEALGLAEGNLAVTVSDPETMIALFEDSLHGLYFKDHDAMRLNRYANVTKIIAEYIRLRRQSMPGKGAEDFEPVLAYMRENLSSELSVQQLVDIRQVAAEVGIADKYYFNKFFEKHCGMLPAGYRGLFR